MRLPREDDPGTMYLGTADPATLDPGIVDPDTVDPEYVNICRDNSQICHLIFALVIIYVFFFKYVNQIRPTCIQHGLHFYQHIFSFMTVIVSCLCKSGSTIYPRHHVIV